MGKKSQCINNYCSINKVIGKKCGRPIAHQLAP
jgi:hypothetical protein